MDKKESLIRCDVDDAEIKIYKGEQLLGIIPCDKSDIAYNDLIFLAHHLLGVKYKKDKFVMKGILEVKDKYRIVGTDLKMSFDDKKYDIKFVGPSFKIKSHKVRFYKVEIPYCDIEHTNRTRCSINIEWTNSNGLGFCKKIRYSFLDKKRGKSRSTKEKSISKYNLSLKIYQDSHNYVCLYKMMNYRVLEKLYQTKINCENQEEVDSYYVEQLRYNVYKGKKLLGSYIENNRNCVYNRLIRTANHLTKVKHGTDALTIKGFLFVVDPFNITKGQKFFMTLGENDYEITKKRFRFSLYTKYVFHYQLEIPYADILQLEIHTRLELRFVDENGFGIDKSVSYNLFDARGTNYRSSKVKNFEDIDTCIYVRQSAKNGIYITNRVINKTDMTKENRKISFAYFLSKLYPKKNIALFYEKMAYKYEESAAVLFESLIEQGYKNIFYIIDKDSPQFDLIPEKYLPYVVFKYSFKHYFYFFRANLFVGTEAMGHSVELRIKNVHVLKKMYADKYKYLFLQHGITYMLSLKCNYRSSFNKNGSFPKNGKVVVSSLEEARHFIDYGNFKFSDLYISGLPKFDKAVRNPDADKIVIMTTWRPWDYNAVRIDPTKSTYYRFIKSIFEQVPEEYLEKVIILPHPLFKETIAENELTKYIPEQFVYDEILKDTALLITDYSSISYDAFYRGANVIFCWEEKDFCMECYDNTLMLNDDNAFADISYQYDDIGNLIRKNYMTQQKAENIEKYKKIVEFSDNKNTDRLIRMLKNDGLIKK